LKFREYSGTYPFVVGPISGFTPRPFNAAVIVVRASVLVHVT
jgi:hypothetical protein